MAMFNLSLSALRTWTTGLSCAAGAASGAALAQAEPRFVSRAQDVVGSHSYVGGWDFFVGGGVAVFNCNGDTLPEIFAAGGAADSRLFLNDSTPGADIRLSQADGPAVSRVTGAYPLDMDGDDVLDLMVLRNGPNVVLRGLGDCQFEDVTTAWGLDVGDAWSTAFSATWEAGQTWPTLAIGNYVDADDPDGPFGACDANRMFRPSGDGYDRPIVLDPGFCPLSMLFSDWRRDGRPMLRVSNDRHYYLHDGREQMWSLDPLRELGEGDGWAPLKLWGMGIASQDLTGDGLPEVMLTSMGDQLLMMNEGTGFAAAPFAIGATAHRPHVGDDGRPSTGWHAQFGDVDNDGRPDLFIAKGNVDQMPGMAMEDPNTLLMQQADGTFAERGATAGIATPHRSRGAALADLNGDGRLDLVVVNRRAPLEVWQNTTEAGQWLAVDPRQAEGNRRAIGAFVEVRTSTGTQIQERTVGGGHVSGTAAPLHFGLGADESAEVRITWPDGTVGPWRQVDAGQILTPHRE
ncbi:hypothetical protein JANAI62_24530 [Jannaschia pagri]|uniref:ASPIC/UnbV domain-containing protein n=1 Tax=Jannaschia pagri TaxID=2829797 RepID=A0ABQ4NN53_9RHOB|nr:MULTISPECIES: CRTAC1 family protein [unclassified Jannaschia]GIT91996.1 hypothetical protein JANAI61_24540 [Jannaschia sp. AI_61]GIT95830.1 hypothetical protein JANAI62_24530 [Jannaschia sp. AI_62]